MNQTRLPIIHLCIFATCVTFGLLMFYYTQAQVRRASVALAQVTQLSESRSRLAQIAELLPRHSISANTWLATLPRDEKEVAAFATNVELLAKANSLSLALSFDDFPGPIDVAGHYIAGVGAEITLEGSYLGINNFIFGLADLPYYFKVDKMTFTKPDNQLGVKAIIDGSLMMNLPI